jgi:HEAT repeat protein
MRRRHNRRRYVRPLIRELLHAGDPKGREAAAYVLSWLGDRRAVHPLLLVAANHREVASLRGQALEALGSISFSRPRPPVEPVIGMLEDPEAQVRFWACYALSQFEDKTAIQAMRRLLSDEAVCPGWWSVKGEAAWAIAELEGDPGADAIWAANSRVRVSGGDPGAGAGSGTG